MKKAGDLKQLRLLNRRGNRLLSATALLLVPLLLGTRVSAASKAVSGPTIADLRCEFRKTPLGIDDRQPALSWTIEDERRGVVQTAYRVLVATSEELLAQDKGDLWDSGLVKSDQSHLIIYQGTPLGSRARCYWKVLVESAAAGGDGVDSTWSEPSWWEMGLLEPEDWEGSWIESPVCRPIDNEVTRLWARMCLVPPERNEFKNDPGAAQTLRAVTQKKLDAVLPAALFRTTFEVPAAVKRARIYLSGLGFHEATLNGLPVSGHIHDPSVTQYKFRGGYVTHDIGSVLRSGRNELSVLVGGGYFHEPVVWGNPGQVDGQPCLRAQIELELMDDRRLVVASDRSWQTTAGPLLKSHYWAGEVFDARATTVGGAAEWSPTTEVAAPVPALVAQRCEPERIVRRVRPVAMHEPKPGIWVFDLGEMIVGTLQLRLEAPAGTAVVLRTAEWTWNPKIQGPQFTASRLHYDEPGSADWSEGMIVGRRRGGSFLAPFHLEVDGQMRHLHPHLGTPTLVYVARGDGAGETWRPSFTLQPMRYIEVQGLETPPTLDTLTGLVVSSDEEVVGSFMCGNPRFNDIFEACMNSTRYNTHGMSWDNAVERLQSQVYNAWSAPFASYLLWYPNLWRKILEDQRLINHPEPGKGQAFANVVYGNRGGPGWATKAPTRMVISESVSVELPLQLCARYGDLRELRLHYPQMKAWLEACVDPATGEVRKGATTGGWNDHFYKETAADSDFEPGFDDEALMSMLLHRWLRETAAAARLLGKNEDAAVLEQTADRVRTHVNRTWYDAANKTYGVAEEKGSRRMDRHDRFHGEYSVASGRSGRIDARYGWHGLMALAVSSGVAPEQDIPAILDNCIADMKEHYRSHHAAGHITHQLLYDVYSAHGMIETCYDMMNATGFPSFAYQLQSGNRTIPEGPAWTDRFPAFASACQNECQEPARWFTETLCGVSPDPAEPGFKHILLRPRIPSQLPSASLFTTTPYGRLESSWKQEAGDVVWTVRIPANSHATAYIPAKSAELIQESSRPLTAAAGCTLQRQGADGIECRLGPGSYQFSFPALANEPSRLGDFR